MHDLLCASHSTEGRGEREKEKRRKTERGREGGEGVTKEAKYTLANDVAQVNYVYILGVVCSVMEYDEQRPQRRMKKKDTIK